MDGCQGMTFFTSCDWQVDKERDITFGVFNFMCEKFKQLIDADVEINQVDLTEDNSFGFCQVDEDGEFLIHVHNDLSLEEYVTTLIHELVHVKQTVQGLKDNEMRESEAYFWERLLCKEYMASPISVTTNAQISA